MSSHRGDRRSRHSAASRSSRSSRSGRHGSRRRKETAEERAKRKKREKRDRKEKKSRSRNKRSERNYHREKILSDQLRKQQLERLDKVSEDHLTEVTFRNRLPQVPVDPKLLANTAITQELTSLFLPDKNYEFNSLETGLFDQRVSMDVYLGLPLDLVDIDNVGTRKRSRRRRKKQKEKQKKKIHDDDRLLLEDSEEEKKRTIRHYEMADLMAKNIWITANDQIANDLTAKGFGQVSASKVHDDRVRDLEQLAFFNKLGLLNYARQLQKVGVRQKRDLHQVDKQILVTRAGMDEVQAAELCNKIDKILDDRQAELVVDAIENTFEQTINNEIPKHPTKRYRKVKKIWNILPSEDMFKQKYAYLMIANKNPSAFVKRKTEVDEDARERIRHSILSDITQEKWGMMCTLGVPRPDDEQEEARSKGSNNGEGTIFEEVGRFEMSIDSETDQALNPVIFTFGDTKVDEKGIERGTVEYSFMRNSVLLRSVRKKKRMTDHMTRYDFKMVRRPDSEAELRNQRIRLERLEPFAEADLETDDGEEEELMELEESHYAGESSTRAKGSDSDGDNLFSSEDDKPDPMKDSGDESPSDNEKEDAINANNAAEDDKPDPMKDSGDESPSDSDAVKKNNSVEDDKPDPMNDSGDESPSDNEKEDAINGKNAADEEGLVDDNDNGNKNEAVSEKETSQDDSRDEKKISRAQ